MLIEHDIQVNLLWFIEVLVCAVALFGAFTSKYRAAYILMFCMVALDLYLWSSFDSLPKGPNRYYLCLGMNSIFILLNFVFARQKGTLKSIKLLVGLSVLNTWEALDVTFNPANSFIDYNYAVLVAVCYFIYTVSTARGLYNARYDNTTTIHDSGTFDISSGSSNSAGSKRYINMQGKGKSCQT